MDWNAAFFILIFKTFNSLVGTMSPIISFILASVLLWILHYIQTLGARNAGILNAIITIAKVIPLLLVIIFGLVMFKIGTFNVANWTSKLTVDGSATSIGTQIKGAMPKWFAKENKNGAPVNSLLITDILTELFLFSILSPALQTAYNDVYTLATVCIYSILIISNVCI